MQVNKINFKIHELRDIQVALKRLQINGSFACIITYTM